MKSWFTVAELAELNLPGLPASSRGVLKFADREGWADQTATDGTRLARRRKGKGGGTEFHKSLLPADARLQLGRLTLKSAVVTPAPERVAEPESFTPADALRRDARLYAVSLADAHARNNPHIGQVVADADAACRWATLDLPTWVHEALPEIGARSLRRWRGLRDGGDWQALAGSYAKGKVGVLECANDGAVAQHIAALLLAQPHLNGSHIRTLVADRFGIALTMDGESRALPTLRAFQRYVADWKKQNAAAFKKVTDPDGFKSSMRFVGGNMNRHVVRLNQLWEIDASPADVLTTDGRFNLYLVVDIYSRRIMALVSQTPTTEASLQLVRRAIIEWGVPETLRTDNGSDFTSYRFKRALNSLAIEHDITAPFSPEQKGTVERHIGTLQRGLMPLLPGFIGHSVEDRKKIEARRAFAQRLGASDDKAFCVDMDAGELQTVIDAWCAGTYGHNGHGGLDGETPFNRAAAYRGTVRRIENARPLDMLLAPVAGNDGFRTVTKRGIRLDGAHFHNGLLPVGEQVFCRCDPEDMGRLYVFEADGGAFICEAICDERVGVDPKAAAAAARNLQSRVLKDGIAEARKEARTIKSRDFVESVKRQADQNHGNVAAFPHRSEPHVTGDLYAAEIAAETERRAPVELTEAQKQRHEKLKAEIEGGGGNVVALPETAKQRFKRAMEIREALERSEQVPPEDARWLGSYEGSAEYRSQSTMVDAFGKSWLEA